MNPCPRSLQQYLLTSSFNLSAKPLEATFSERRFGYITVVKLLLYFSMHSYNIFKPVSLFLKNLPGGTALISHTKNLWGCGFLSGFADEIIRMCVYEVSSRLDTVHMHKNISRKLNVESSSPSPPSSILPHRSHQAIRGEEN